MRAASRWAPRAISRFTARARTSSVPLLRTTLKRRSSIIASAVCARTSGCSNSLVRLHLLSGLLGRGAPDVQVAQVALSRPRSCWNVQAFKQRRSVPFPLPVVRWLAAPALDRRPALALRPYVQLPQVALPPPRANLISMNLPPPPDSPTAFCGDLVGVLAVGAISSRR
jgi:hypothetical protein